MTDLGTGRRTGATRLRVEFYEPLEGRGLTLAELVSQLSGLESLLVIGYWTQYKQLWSPEVRKDMPTDPRPVLEKDLKLARLSYESPLQIVLEVVGTSLTVGTGVLYFMMRWEDWRAKRAKTNLQKAAYEHLAKYLPEDLPKSRRQRLIEEVLRNRSEKPGLMLPSEEEKWAASEVLPLIRRITLEGRGS